MEDFNDTAAGCVVISCCCPCLLLQFALFVFLGLPRKLVAKSKKMMMTRKMKSKKRLDVQDTKKINKEVFELSSYLQTEKKEISTEVKRDEDEKTLLGDDEVLEELVRQGMFWFGSFWREGREEIQLELSFGCPIFCDDVYYRGKEMRMCEF